MIIRYPTGLYDSFGRLAQSTNITWHISSEDPPRSNNIVIKIPIAEESQDLPGFEYERKTRRQAFGKLIYTINEANRTVAGSIVKLFAEGDVLDFQDDDRADLNIPRSDRLEAQHSLNEIDLEAAGLNSNDIENFNSLIYDKKITLEKQFLVIRAEIHDIETGIQEIQKKINESNKALEAVRILGDKDLGAKIEEKRVTYQDEHDALAKQHNTKTEELAVVVNNLGKIDMVAK